MPIKKMQMKAAFPRLGQLRKGAPKPKEGNRPGKDLTYFRFVSDDRDANVAFIDAYPSEPRRINVYLPFATTDENLETWMEEWGAGSLKHRCDGEKCVLWQDESGLYHTEPKRCPGNCKPSGQLMVIIPELRRLAYVEVLTTSWWDCQELTQNIMAAEIVASGIGKDLRGIPFILTRKMREISTPPREKGGKRIRAEKWLLHLEPAPSWVTLQIEAARQSAEPKLLEGPEEYAEYLENGEHDEEAEFESTTPEPVTPSPSQKRSRPYDAEIVKTGLAQKVIKGKVDPPSEKLLAYARASLAKVTLNDDDHRHSITLYLFGKESTSDLTAAECSAIVDWVDAKEPDYEPSPHAIEEAKRIVRTWQIEQGQGELPLDEVPY